MEQKRLQGKCCYVCMLVLIGIITLSGCGNKGEKEVLLTRIKAGMEKEVAEFDYVASGKELKITDKADKAEMLEVIAEQEYEPVDLVELEGWTNFSIVTDTETLYISFTSEYANFDGKFYRVENGNNIIKDLQSYFFKKYKYF